MQHEVNHVALPLSIARGAVVHASMELWAQPLADTDDEPQQGDER